MKLPQVFGEFYKYRGLRTPDERQHVRDAIVERKISFTRPSELNDPFDCYPNLTLSLSPAECRSFVVKLVRDQLAQKGVRLSRTKIDATVAGTMKTLLDPKTRGRELFDMLDERTGVFCMSRDCAVASQWAYYGDNHRGLCLQFTITSDVPITVVEVTYGSMRVSIDAVDLLRKAPGAEEALFGALVAKSNIWRSEDEVRALSRAPGIAPYPEGMLTGIVFGGRTSDDDVAWVRSVVEEAELTLSYSRIVPDDTTYQLKRVSL